MKQTDVSDSNLAASQSCSVSCHDAAKIEVEDHGALANSSWEVCLMHTACNRHNKSAIQHLPTAMTAGQASCGGTHTMVLTAEGRIFAWGRGSFGRLGTGLEKDCHFPVEVFLPGLSKLILHW